MKTAIKLLLFFTFCFNCCVAANPPKFTYIKIWTCIFCMSTFFGDDPPQSNCIKGGDSPDVWKLTDIIIIKDGKAFTKIKYDPT